MKFYYSTATCSTVTHIALNEAGLSFTGVEVSWKRNVNVEELAKVSALGAVPALVLDNGKVLTQNSTILEYIADQKPEMHFLAKPGSLERLETMSWVAFAAADFQKAFGPVLGGGRMTTSETAKQEMREYGTKVINKYLAHLESNLNGKDYITGKDYTVADMALFTFIGWCKWAEIKTAPYKNVSAYAKRIYARPAVQKTLAAESLTDYLQD